jgi:hypothetical protein
MNTAEKQPSQKHFLRTVSPSEGVCSGSSFDIVFQQAAEESKFVVCNAHYCEAQDAIGIGPSQIAAG